MMLEDKSSSQMIDEVFSENSVAKPVITIQHSRGLFKLDLDAVWYYRELLGFFIQRRDGPLVEDLSEAVGDLTDLLGSDDRRGDRCGFAELHREGAAWLPQA